HTDSESRVVLRSVNFDRLVLHTQRHAFYTRVSRGTHYGTLRATTEKFSKIRKITVILCPTRESNPRPLVRQSHLRPLDQRGRGEPIIMSVLPLSNFRKKPSNSLLDLGIEPETPLFSSRTCDHSTNGQSSILSVQ
ncbi:hypothetical protein SFRURICE_011019, partial [Spodoptera frugiperda]